MTSPQRRVSRHLSQSTQVRLAVTITGVGADGVALNQSVQELLQFMHPDFEVEVAPLTRQGGRRSQRLFDDDGVEVPDPFEDEPGGVRWDDPTASRLGAEDIGPRGGNQKRQIFEVFVRDYLAHGGDGTGPAGGLIAYDCGVRTGLILKDGCCYWHRVSDLKKKGFVQHTGELRRRPDNRKLQHVHVITGRGWRWWRMNGWELR